MWNGAEVRGGGGGRYRERGTKHLTKMRKMFMAHKPCTRSFCIYICGRGGEYYTIKEWKKGKRRKIVEYTVEHTTFQRVRGEV